jgi:threonine/homoserine/homoserine lactone efflux protein
MPLDRWLLFCLACAVLVATPGPNVLYNVSRTLAQGRVAGFISLAGTTSGSGLHVLAAALGLSALLVAVPIAYEAVRWGGAAYLAWLAVVTWRSPAASVEGDRPPTPRARLWREGFLVGVLNPKVAVFELALFPQFVVPGRGDVLGQSLLLGATQMAIALAGDSLYVLLAAGARRWLTSSPLFARASKRALATMFALLAVRLVWDDRR